MPILDRLRSAANIAAAFAASNKAAINAAGGYAFWQIPPALARGFNPLTFRRDRFLHRIVGNTAYTPTQACKPNCARITSGTDIVFDYPTASTLRIVVQGTKNGQPLTRAYTPSAGTATFHLSNDFDTLTAIVSLGFYSYEQGDYCADNAYIYIRQGATYEDEDFIVNGAGLVMYRDTASVEAVALDLRGEAGRKFTLTATSYKGSVFFDASPVVRHWFAATPAETADAATPVLDRLLFVRYTAKSGTFDFDGKQFLAANAVAQVGESENLAGLEGCVLTSLPTLYLYDGYPFDYSVLAGAQEVHLENGGIFRPYSIARVGFVESDYINLLDEQGIEIHTEGDLPILLLPSFDIPVRGRRTPLKPFYVRWVNALGGIDYFMFSKHHTRKPAVKSSALYRPYVGSNADAGTNRLPYGISTEHELTCGAQGLTREEFRALGWLPFSPYIEYYDTDLGKWLRLAVSKYSGSLDDWDETKAFEITFALPDINTQF